MWKQLNCTRFASLTCLPQQRMHGEYKTRAISAVREQLNLTGLANLINAWQMFEIVQFLRGCNITSIRHFFICHSLYITLTLFLMICHGLSSALVFCVYDTSASHSTERRLHMHLPQMLSIILRVPSATYLFAQIARGTRCFGYAQ